MKENQNVCPAITQRDVNRIFAAELRISEKKVQWELRNILQKHFPRITDKRCSHAIYQAHRKKEGVLIKDGIYYKLCPHHHTIKGIDKVSIRIIELIGNLEAMPIGDFKETSAKFALEDVIEDLSMIVRKLDGRYNN